MTRVLILVLAGVLAGCRGRVTDMSPIHINPNMDDMERYDAQEESPFFADNRTMRPPVPGTIARGMLKADTEYYQGRGGTGSYVARMPMEYTRQLALRGQDRYDIFCAVCHGDAGDGQGIVMMGGYGFAPFSYHDARLRGVEDGYLYDVIANGVRTMPGYGHQVPVTDRWAIVAYIRALQRSQNATASDIPDDILTTLTP